MGWEGTGAFVLHLQLKVKDLSSQNTTLDKV